MRLIIDIPEEAYELLKSKSELDNIAESIIANGTPVSNKGDLISREALKKAITEATYNFEQIPIRVNKVQEIIDNAPTVPDRTEEVLSLQNTIAKLVEGIAESARSQGEWIPVSERLPEERINPYIKDFEYVLCSTIWGDVRPYKFGKQIGENKAHFWLGGEVMDKYITAWQSFPEPYKKGGAE